MNHSLGLLKAPHAGDGVLRFLAIRARSASRRGLRVTRTTAVVLGLVLPVRVGLAQRAEPGAPSSHPPTRAPGQTLPGGDRSGPIDEELPPEDSGPPPSAASDEEIDLAALGLDENAPSLDDQLNVYGFASFAYISRHPSAGVVPVVRESKTFMFGNLNLYLAKNLTERARTLAEIAFTFLPNGSRNADGTVVDTTVTDLTNYDRTAQWGGIVIERAYLEYDVTDFLTIRGGRWLTPYGIWNIDHGAPVIISTGRPFIIGEQLFPEHQTGLDLFGSRSYAGYQLSYHLTVSNGRGGSDAQQDQDDKFAFGGRLELELPWGLRIGGSYYRGRYTGLPPAAGEPALTYLEAAYGGDAQLELDGLRVQGEIVVRDRHDAADARAAAAANDARDSGWYVLVGYRFNHFWNVMPFLYYEDTAPSNVMVTENLTAKIVGLNFRPSSSLTFKATVNQIGFNGAGSAHGTSYEIFSLAAWVF